MAGMREILAVALMATLGCEVADFEVQRSGSTTIPRGPTGEDLEMMRLDDMELVLAESLLIAITGGTAGLWLAHFVTQQDITSGLILLYLLPVALAGGGAFAAGAGLLAGVLPAIGAMRLNVARHGRCGRRVASGLRVLPISVALPVVRARCRAR